KIASNGVPPFVGDEIGQSLQDFIKGVDIIGKTDETVAGVATYHYQVNSSDATTKKLSSSLSDIFFTTLSPDMRVGLDQGLGAVSLDSIEVWVGKADSNVYQYKIIATIPLSKVLGIEDKGLGDSRVKLEWVTKIHDLGVVNKIDIPTEVTAMSDFVKSVNDMNIKDALDTLKTSAQTFHNASGNFGKASNPTGSCAKPADRSLFSPTGHAASASIAVGDIATNLSALIALVGDRESCYSTTSAWAAAAQLASDPTSFYCVDDKGKAILTNKISGPACK
ncbi:MAG: hypothetical protein WCK91_00465, partial [bacterium]